MLVNNCMKLSLAVWVLLGAVMPAASGNGEKLEAGRAPGLSREQENTEKILAIFSAIEKRDNTQMLQLFQPDIEMHWPSSLPYGGTFRGLEPRPNGWGATWGPLQPTQAERKMDPRVIAAHDDDVVVLWRQRGRSAAEETLDAEVLGLYHFRDGKLARAQMFYFDTAVVAGFLAKAQGMK